MMLGFSMRRSPLRCHPRERAHQDPVARAAMDHDLESLIHLMLVNRGTLLAPFHNMMLVSPFTQAAQVDRLAAELNNALTELLV